MRRSRCLGIPFATSNSGSPLLGHQGTDPARQFYKTLHLLLTVYIKHTLWSSTERCPFRVFRFSEAKRSVEQIQLSLRNGKMEVNCNVSPPQFLWKLQSRLVQKVGCPEHLLGHRRHIMGHCWVTLMWRWAEPKQIKKHWNKTSIYILLQFSYTSKHSSFCATSVTACHSPAFLIVYACFEKMCIPKPRSLRYYVVFFSCFHAFLHQRAFCFGLLSYSLLSSSATDVFSVTNICLLYYPLISFMLYYVSQPQLSQNAIRSLSLVHVYESWKVLRVSSALFL